MKDLFRMRLSRGLAGVVIVLTALIVGAGVHELDRVEALAEVASLRVTTDLIRETIPALDRLDRSALMTIRDAAGLAEVRVVIARPDGSVLLDTESAPGAIAARDPLPERLRLEHGTGPTILTASRDPEGRPARVVVRPLSSAGSLPGQIVAIRAPGRPRVDSVSPTLRFLLVALGLMGAALGLLAVLVRRAVAFLEVVDHVVETVAAGNLSRTEVDAMGEDMGYFGSHLNIIATQLQERLDVIIDERRRSERILESIGDGVIAVDADGSILMVNDTARKLLGVGGDLVAQRPGENLGPDLRRLVAWSRDPVESTLLTEVGPGPTPVEIRCDDLPLGESAQGRVLLVRDLSESRRLDALRERFIADASHEMRTPVTTIQAMLEPLIRSEGVDDETRRSFLGRIEVQVQRLARLSENLRVLSRLDWGSRPPDPLEVDLVQVLEEVADPFVEVAREKGPRFELKIPEKALLVEAAPDDMYHIMENLLDNAFKYTPAEGRVQVRLLEADDRLVLEVEDSGIGIEEGALPHVFERFYRVDRERSRDPGGTGLGLAIVSRAVEQSGGRIRVESVPGEGTLFRVSWPRARPGPGSTDDPRPGEVCAA